MKVTPLDIRQQQFPVRFRGFDQVEVDAFLELVASDLEALMRENTRLKENLAKREQDIQRMHEGEADLKKALIAMHQIKEEWVARAQTQAGQILREAESQSRDIVSEAERRLVALQQQVQDLERQRHDLVLQLRRVLDHYLQLLETEEATEPPLPETLELPSHAGDEAPGEA
jgi:cell division initiation protein